MNHKKPLIMIAGPTGVGKTEFSIQLAKAVNGEIISADSMQVYRGMDIGSAKISPDEMQGVPHHLIDILNPDEEFNIYQFQTLAKQAMDDIVYPAGHIPLIVGGTGFYIQSVVYDVDFSENAGDTSYRDSLQKIAEESPEGAGILYRMLLETDPASAAIIHKNNVRRVIRALEFYHETNGCCKLSEHNMKQREKESDYAFAYFVLTMNRQRLYERIDRRVDLMLEQGLVEEVRRLKEMGCHRQMCSMKGIGYKEVLEYLEGEMTYDRMVEVLKQNTRHFAKRQLTWFRREKDVIWLDKEEHKTPKAMLNYALDCCRERGVIT